MTSAQAIAHVVSVRADVAADYARRTRVLTDLDRKHLNDTAMLQLAALDLAIAALKETIR